MRVTGLLQYSLLRIIPNTSLHNPVVIPLKFLHIFCAKRTGHCQAFLWDSCWILGILMPSFQNPSFCYGFASLASETEDFKSLHMFLICTIFWDVKIFMGFSSPSAETCKNHIITYGFDMRHGGSYLLILSGLDIFWYFQALMFFDMAALWTEVYVRFCFGSKSLPRLLEPNLVWQFCFAAW